MFRSILCLQAGHGLEAAHLQAFSVQEEIFWPTGNSSWNLNSSLSPFYTETPQLRHPNALSTFPTECNRNSAIWDPLFRMACTAWRQFFTRLQGLVHKWLWRPHNASTSDRTPKQKGEPRSRSLLTSWLTISFTRLQARPSLSWAVRRCSAYSQPNTLNFTHQRSC